MSRVGRCALLVICLLAVTAGSQPPGRAGKGSPRTAPSIDDVYANFKTPPPGYGEVAFYWWVGDTLTRDRIRWQLDQLQGKGVIGLQVNYAHTDSGGLIWGLSMQSQPKLFSEEWWELFGWFMQEAKQRGMSVSLSDYTLGVGQGSYVDDALADHPGLVGSELRFDKRFVAGTTPLAWKLRGDPISISAFKVGSDSLPLPGTRADLSRHVKDRELRWTPPGGSWMVSCVWGNDVTLARVVTARDTGTLAQLR